MKKFKLSRFLWLFLIFDLLVNVIIFIATPPELRQDANFWIAWVFAFPLSWLTMYLLSVYTASERLTRLMAMRSLGSCYVTFDLIYLVWFFVAAYVLKKDGLLVTVIVEVIISILYVFVVYKRLLSVSLLRSVNQEQEKIVQQRKSNYIPSLLRMIDVALPTVTDPTLQLQLGSLRDAIEASTPTSPDIAKRKEAELRALVSQICNLITLGETADIASQIMAANVKLNERNALCQSV